MAYEIVIKKQFLNKLVRVLAYLEQEWGNNVAAGFLEKVDKRIESLKTHPFIGAPSTRIKNVRGLHITKHNRLFYRIEGNKVIILNLYDTRKNA